ncbi:MAG: DUF5060 domain-containing protein [Lentisphaerae bacterium]|jgi:hypothetical protein|nr:DUF5060 domain-containing protein [Lentisphaerota bacterium]MBT4822759.1 DUF5060 domain-containing protein [Lentisphaerota bacterium]MBT5608037.1 DUF5060 domain-containing protein [Lentisphaerota bacterium]MBT7056495.1 DUF5060 domain-containing protein [Lentisphaerota bacterium]MBT7840726.1 DUF5060 domain-containing protein [Lentisphaerota bacterium]
MPGCQATPPAGRHSAGFPLLPALQGALPRVLVCLTVACLCAKPAQAAPEPDDIGVSFAWDESGRLSVQHAGETIVSYEQLQLIDRREGWRVVSGYGKDVDLQAGGGGTELIVREEIPQILTYTKKAKGIANGLQWSLRYAISAGTGTTDNYYYLDIPAGTLYGTAYQSQTPRGPRFGEITKEGGIGSQPPITGITFYDARRELQFELGGKGAEWRLTDWSAAPHGSFRLRIEKAVAEAAVEAEATVRLTVRPGVADAGARIAAKAREFRRAEREAQLEAAGLSSKAPLAFAVPSPPRKTVGQYEVFDLDFQVGGTYTNPFDPEQIDVSAEVKLPDGSTAVRPAYFRREPSQGAAGWRSGKTEGWRVRFTPTLTGQHRFRITARNQGKEAAGPEGSFDCTPRTTRGFVRTSKQSRLYLDFENGESYVPSGINLFYMTRLGKGVPPERLEKCLAWMNQLADNAGNFVRLRMDSWWLAIEMTPDPETGYLGLGYYHQQTCWEIDQIYELAARRGLQVMHCLDNANGNVNASKQSWRRPYDLYIEENGGVCDQPEEFWSHQEARRMVRNKLRYCVARWGGHPNLMAWEFWNEVSCREPMIENATLWHRDMARYLRSIDCNAHPVTTSLMGDKTLADRIWALPEMDIIQYHFYGRTELAPGLLTLTRPSIEKHEKPFFVGEYGVGPQFRPGNAEYDPDGVQLHNGMWGSLFAGGAGAGAWWYVKSYLDRFNLYGQYRPLAEFALRVPWTAPEFRVCSLPEPTFVEAPEQRHFEDVPLPLSSQYAFKIPPVTRIEIDSRGNLKQPEMLRGQLNCAEGRKAPPTFVTCFDRPVDLIIHVTQSVGDASNTLLVDLDGERAIKTPFPAGKEADPKSEYIEAYDNWRTAYDERIVVPVPPGQHEIRVEALGKDRLEVEYKLGGAVAFEDLAPLRVRGFRTDNAIYAWLQNRSSTWRRLWDGKAPIPLPKMRLTCPQLPQGTYRVEWFDTWTGKTLGSQKVEAADRPLVLSIPPIDRDVACLIEQVK